MSTEVRQIYDVFKATGARVPRERHRGEFGVEIETEVESSRAYDYPTLKFWDAKKDNSLRDYGVEYVLKSPMSSVEISKALEEFALCEKKYKFRKGSVSTSVHVHLNFNNESFLTLANFFTSYSLLENLLIRYSGPDRLSNLFCLPMCDAEGVVDNIKSLLSYVDRKMYNKMALSPDKVKYGGINPSTLTTLGTIEIRTFRGETDVEIISRWLKILKKIKDFSRSEGLTPPQILELYKNHKDLILDVILQEYANEIRFKDKTGKDITHELIRQNLKYAADFSCISKDWPKFGVFKPKEVYKEMVKSQLDELAMSLFSVNFDTLKYPERLLIQERYQTMNPNIKVVDLNTDL